MKFIIHTLTYCFIVTQIFAQSTPNFSEKENADWRSFKSAEQVTATELKRDKAQLGLDTHDELNLLESKTDALGFRHHRYQQSYKGIPIEGAIYLMHEKNNRVQHANGKLIRQLKLTTTPTINEATALQAALRYMDADLYAWNDPTHEDMLKQTKERPDATFYPESELVIVAPDGERKADNYRLAYKLDIYAVEPLSRQLVYIDAQNGTVITTLEKIHNCTDVPASGATNYSGDVDFMSCQSNGTHVLADRGNGVIKQVFDALNTWQISFMPFTDTDGFFESDSTATEVHWATQKTFDYFLNTHQRNSLDGNGMPLYSWVHFRSNYPNAHWNGAWLLYGDGDNDRFTSFTAPDVVAHEMTHGITDFSADLVYRNESGALNESFSDIFGEVAERHMRGINDWLMGADFTVQPGKTTLRNLSNPNDPTAMTRQPDTYHGNFWYYGTGDSGGVHYNSGVQNYWFYLLSEGGSGTNDNGDAYDLGGIGMDKAADIAYRSLTTYLTPHAEYADARNAAIQAAIDLYGLDSYEAEQTALAWCAVGVGGCSFVAPCRERDSLALVALYNATDPLNLDWDFYQPIDTWEGVVLNESDCVEELYFYGDISIGRIPAEIGDLMSLQVLRVTTSNSIDSIAPEIGNLVELRTLYLEGNYLIENIPPEIGNLSNLQILNISSATEMYAGQLKNIPAEIGNLLNLEMLSLSTNYITQVPIEIGNLVNLKVLELSGSIFFGGGQLTNLPEEIGDLSKLERLDLSGNQISNLPLELGNLGKLKELHLVGNQIVSFPNEIRDLNNLEILNVSYNQLSNIPFEVNDLVGLTRLNLSHNEINGSILLDFDNLTNLSTLDLSKNQFTGNIPSEIENLESIEYLILSENQLTETIPPEIGNLSNLRGLLLNDNMLTGNIPQEIGSLSELKTLMLYNNELSGCYSANLEVLCNQLSPFEVSYRISHGNNFTTTWEDFCNTGNDTCPYTPPPCRQSDSLALVALYNSTNGPNWTNTWDLSQPMDTWYRIELDVNGCVSELKLGYNQLNGSIPTQIGDLTNLIILELRNNDLSGGIPSEIGNLFNLTKLDLTNNELTGSIPPEFGNLINLGILYMSDNQLSGNIPPELGLTNLYFLRLSSNQLTGEIPAELANLGLSHLYLNDNQLTGEITELGRLPFFVWKLNLANNQFTGSIPPEFGDIFFNDVLDLSNNNFSGCYDANLSKLCGINHLIVFKIDEGNNFDMPFSDFCATGAGVCDPVYPGDFDNNGIVDIDDVLMWGLSTNNNGAARHNATTAWTPQACIDWQAVINGVNAKYQDGNGDGINNVADLQVWASNFDSTHTFTGATLTDSPLYFRIEQTDQVTENGQITTTYSLFTESLLDTPVSVHGLAFSAYLGGTPTLSVHTDTIGSPLGANIMAEQYDFTNNTYHLALTRTDLNNQLIDGSVAQIIVVHDDLQAGEPLAFFLSGSTMSATGDFLPVDNTSFYGSLDIPGASASVSVSASVVHESCYNFGTATVHANNGAEPYTYTWSNGATTAQADSLTAGIYTVTVTDIDGNYQVIGIQIDAYEPVYDQAGNEVDCSQFIRSVNMDIHATLEGAHELNTGLMTANLLPMLDTLGGQPYHHAPWNYRGTEGQDWYAADYPSSTIDWVLATFRDGADMSKVLTKAAAVLLEDGTLHFPYDRIFATNPPDSVYVVIEHRNHIAVMTPQPVTITNNTLTYDFRGENSYRMPASAGQKQLSDGTWTMFAGDCKQVGDTGYDINGADKGLWADFNGVFGFYVLPDFNLDGDVNGADKGFWFSNSGTFSTVPK